MHYLDHSATTAVSEAAAQAALEMMRCQFGNPSSQHKMGIEAARRLKEARGIIASALSCAPEELFFTSGGTESTNTALYGAAMKNRHLGRHIITTELEHSATLQMCRRLENEGFSVTYLKPDADGHISVDTFSAAVREDTILASAMVVNNEVGTVLDIAGFTAALKARNPQALFHADAVQAFCKIPVTPGKWGCDFLSVSGHKIGAPKGVGALYIRRGVRVHSYLVGGGQENGMRSGTEPMPNIMAFAAACTERKNGMQEAYAHVEHLNAMLRQAIAEQFPWAMINGTADIPYVLNVSFTGCKSEVMLRVLESAEVYVSAGSACAKGKESHVLKAMGMDGKRIDCALRISFGPSNTEEDIEAFLAAVGKGAKMLKR